MCRLEILNDFGIRLEGMNAQHRRLGLPPIDTDQLGAAERIIHMRVLLDAIEADVLLGRVDDRLVVNLGAHALGWVEAVRAGRPPLRAVSDVPVVPADGGRHGEFLPGDAA